MTDLSPKAATLVRAGRSAWKPSDADRLRIEASLRARLGPAALSEAAAPASSAAPVGHAAWLKFGAVVVTAGAVVGSLVALGQSPEPLVLQRMPTTVVESTRLPSEPPKADGEDSVEPPSPAAEAAPAARGPAPTRPPDRLAQEVALLSRATSALRAGRAGEALTSLDQHQREFPKGLLAAERRAARAQALCVLGRRTEAERELARLPRNSPHSARARQACTNRP